MQNCTIASLLWENQDKGGSYNTSYIHPGLSSLTNLTQTFAIYFSQFSEVTGWHIQKGTTFRTIYFDSCLAESLAHSKHSVNMHINLSTLALVFVWSDIKIWHVFMAFWKFIILLRMIIYKVTNLKFRNRFVIYI